MAEGEKDMLNADAVIIKLLELGIIERSQHRGCYYIVDQPRERTFNRAQIYSRFTDEVMPGRFTLKLEEIAGAKNQSRPQRRINRDYYHSGSRNYEPYISAVPVDEDGVRRTFGLEYEIYQLTLAQESDLAYLLDTLPPHITERDGSLGSNGVEIIFMPMGREQYIQTVKKLREFVEGHHVIMQADSDRQAGMHTTYGVSNAEATEEDLQIRLNRFALAIMALGRKEVITNLFGRYFGNYRELPRSTTHNTHSNAFSTNGRPRTCWECRLPSWKANPEKLVEFFRITESAFHRAFNSEDFEAMFNLLGRDTSGC